MSMFDIVMGSGTLITGLADQPDGTLKVYVGARYRRNYVVVSDSTAQDKVRRAWGDGLSGAHMFTTLPPDTAIFTDPPGDDGEAIVRGDQ